MAELALAIVPLCLSAMKGINTVRKKLKVLRHHDVEIKRLRKKFNTETEVFLDECQLLLQEAIDPRTAQALIENFNDPGWNSPDLDDSIRTYLGRKYDTYRETLDEIKEHIGTLSSDLGSATDAETCVDVKQKGPATREAFSVARNKSKYESSIEDFKAANSALKRHRKTAAKIQRRQTKSCSKRPRPLPQSYQQTAHHSKSFFEALRRFWTCLQSQHTGHDVRLLIDNRYDGSLRVVVRYQTQSGLQVRSGIMDLLVHSQSLSLVHISMPTTIAPPTRRDSGEERPAKARRVKFVDDYSSAAPVASSSKVAFSSSSTATETIATKSTKELGAPRVANLCSVRDLCSQLCAHDCRGYLDTTDQVRHYLSPVCGSSCDHRECLTKQGLRDPRPLDSIFQYPIERTLSVPDQLRLALKLVKGVLQFQSTPWLQPLWRLQDLAYFEPTADLATALATLHISLELSHSRRQDTLMAGTGGSDDNDDGDGLREAQRTYGIRNLTMHSLGVALLQIGQWDDGTSSASSSRLAVDDIAQVRRVADVAERGSRLGPRYQKITQQCLDCDFGFGKNLATPELQSAVYRDVVCELEGLICTLEGRRAPALVAV